MDVSGSMTDEQKEIVRTEAFWIDAWLGQQYRGIEKRYIIHDAVAKEVDEHTFYHTRESGGTRISSAYKAAAELIDRSFPAGRLEPVLSSSSPTATTGATTTARRSSCSARSCCRRQPVLLRPGRKPLRQRRLHRRPGKAVRRPRKTGRSRRSLTRMRFTSRSARFLGKGK